MEKLSTSGLSIKPVALKEEEASRLFTMLRNNEFIVEILSRAPRLDLPNWYLGAGCIAQTVWNLLHGFEPSQNIQDYDLVYFDPTDLSYEAEDREIRRAQSRFHDLGMTVDVKNQARVHLWYQEHFGHPIPPYGSVEDAIGSWPTTATSVGVRSQDNGDFIVRAPFGLNDLFSMIVRPNRKQVTREVYTNKAERWARVWPKLTVIPWDSE